MAITAPTGLSTAQKERLERFDPTMDATNAIPATIASKTDVSTVISDLASTSAGKGASQIGIEDGGSLITATTVEGALAELATSVGGAPAAHAASHVGADSIQDATAGQKGLATAAQITKLDGIEALADVTDDANVRAALAAATAAVAFNNQNITTVGTVDGRDVSADGTKLDGIEALADVTDLANVTTALGVTAAAAVNSTTGGAGNDGKLLKLDGTGKVDGYSATNWDLIAGHEAALAATPSTQLGIERHIKVSTAGGATADTDTVLPPGTWECTRAEVVNRGLGTAGDTIQVIAQGVGTITDAMDINGKAAGVITRPATLATGVNMVGGTNALRVTETDGAGNDSPACDVHVWLRQVA